MQILSDEADSLGLNNATVYHGYPRYRDEVGDLLVPQFVVVSEWYGVVIIGTTNASPAQGTELEALDQSLDQFFAMLNSKFVSIRPLRKSRSMLLFDMEGLIYAPSFKSDGSFETSSPIISAPLEVRRFFENHKASEVIDEAIIEEIKATIDGSRAIPRPKKRDLAGQAENSRGNQVAHLETELATFDMKQRQGIVGEINGPWRIRGLAGSGKTIVMTRKAALTHLDEPEANILYCFYTKSLYQHIRRLITRFYRNDHDTDPDWSRISVMHGWGTREDPGVYTTTCRRLGVRPIAFTEAAQIAPRGEFDHVCTQLLNSSTIIPVYDYIFIDEGQDYPASFLRLCNLLVKGGKFTWAYDELQTIFQPRAPSPSEVWGTDKSGVSRVEFAKDIVLYKCYRNPREILVVAHALGFGIYGPRIVQMLENAEHWRDIGYEVRQGPLESNSQVIIERPEENSLKSISSSNAIDEIVKAESFASFAEEVDFVVKSIEQDLKDGLQPDDIAVIVVDDLHAKDYLREISVGLADKKIRTNNIHNSFGVVDFQMDEHITLTTVHKAKGNEAFMVYVVGIDGLFLYPTKRNRNTLFTAITRAKAWVRLSGIGETMSNCKLEVQRAISNFPNLTFTYPPPEDLEVMRRDLDQGAISELEAERVLASIPRELIEQYMKRQKGSSKSKKN